MRTCEYVSDIGDRQAETSASDAVRCAAVRNGWFINLIHGERVHSNGSGRTDGWTQERAHINSMMLMYSNECAALVLQTHGYLCAQIFCVDVRD